MADVLKCGIIVSEVELQSFYCDHFQTNTFQKGMRTLIRQIWFQYYHFSYSPRMASVWNNPWSFDKLFNKGTKPNQTKTIKVWYAFKQTKQTKPQRFNMPLSNANQTKPNQTSKVWYDIKQRYQTKLNQNEPQRFDKQLNKETKWNQVQLNYNGLICH